MMDVLNQAAGLDRSESPFTRLASTKGVRMYTKSLALLLTFALVTLANANSASIESARDSATAWLKIVDQLEYEKSWSQASPLLQAEVSQDDWGDHLGNMRERLGELRQRTLSSSEFHESLPEMPDGQYVIFTYDSSFENSEYVTEVVAVAKDTNQSWRVIGYYFP